MARACRELRVFRERQGAYQASLMLKEDIHRSRCELLFAQEEHIVVVQGMIDNTSRSEAVQRSAVVAEEKMEWIVVARHHPFHLMCHTLLVEEVWERSLVALQQEVEYEAFVTALLPIITTEADEWALITTPRHTPPPCFHPACRVLRHHLTFLLSPNPSTFLRSLAMQSTYYRLRFEEAAYEHIVLLDHLVEWADKEEQVVRHSIVAEHTAWVALSLVKWEALQRHAIVVTEGAAWCELDEHAARCRLWFCGLGERATLGLEMLEGEMNAYCTSVASVENLTRRRMEAAFRRMALCIEQRAVSHCEAVCRGSTLQAESLAWKKLADSAACERQRTAAQTITRFWGSATRRRHATRALRSRRHAAQSYLALQEAVECMSHLGDVHIDSTCSQMLTFLLDAEDAHRAHVSRTALAEALVLGGVWHCYKNTVLEKTMHSVEHSVEEATDDESQHAESAR
eukprot:Sspe_Gene.7560::Locus_2569_Transcript_1_1_Confidence_1.000_Length_1369::g.7560::m.7560